MGKRSVSDPKNIDAHRDEREAGAEDEARSMLLDLLYGELDGEEQERAEREVREDETLAGELEGWSRVRELMRELPEEEPPDALSTKLLHAAAAEAGKAHDSAASRAGAADGERLSVWARLKELLMPVALHPGLAAAASLVLVAGVTGALYVSGRSPGTEMRAESSAPAQAVAAGEAAAGKAEMAEVVDRKLADEATADRTASAGEPEADLGASADSLAYEDEAAPRGGLSREAQGGLAEGKRAAAEGAGRGAERSSRAPARRAKSKSKAESYRKGDLTKKRAAGKRAPSADLDDGVFGGVIGGSLGGKAQNQAPASGDFAEPPPAGPAAQAPPPPAKPSERPRGSAGGGGAGAPVAEPVPAPAPAPEEESGADMEAPSDSASERRQEKAASDARTRARSLYRQALIAAGKDECAAVVELATRVRRLDAGFYDDVFARDAKLRDCMRSKNAVKK